MAFLKISALPSIPEVADDDELAIVDTSETTTSKVTISDFLANITSISSVSGSDEAHLVTRVTPNPQSLIATTDGTMTSQVAAFTESTSTGARAAAEDGAYESELSVSASSANGEASGGVDITDGSSSVQVGGSIASGNAAGAMLAQSGALAASIQALLNVSGSVSGLTLSTINGTLAERARIVMESAQSIDFEALGSTIPLNESGHEALPAGITSIVQGLGLLDTDKLDANKITKGTWSPTVTAVTNISAASLISSFGRYFQYEDYVFGFVRLSITPESSGTVVARFELPVASNLSLSNHVFGVSSGSDFTQGRCYADTTNDEINISGTRAATSAQSVDVFFLYTVQ